MRISRLLILATALFLMVSCQNKAQKEQIEPEIHELLTVTSQDYTLDAEYPASIQGAQDIKIIPRVEGHLMGVYVKEGERVREGQLLFRLDDAPSRAAVESANANVQMMTAALSRVQLEYNGKKRTCGRNRLFQNSSCRWPKATSMWRKRTSQQRRQPSPPPATTSVTPKSEVRPTVWWAESFTARATL